MFRRFFRPRFFLSLPESVIGCIVAILLFFLVWFLTLVIPELFSEQKGHDLKLRHSFMGRM